MSMPSFSLELVKRLVRDVPDFPKQGIMFKDITPMLATPGALAYVCDELARPFLNKGIKKVLAIESRGFFFGTGIADRLSAGLVPVRKAGKLPWDCVAETYSLEYGSATLELHKDSVAHGERVLIVDDVLATGGTLKATRALAQRLGADVVGASCFLELGFLNGRQALEGLAVDSLWKI